MDNLHWSQTFFKKNILSIQTLKGSFQQHRTEIITLDDQSKWICKVFSESNWLGPLEASQIAITSEIATAVEQKLGCTSAPVFCSSTERIATDLPLTLITPYCEGEVIHSVNETQAFQLGYLLAQLHALKWPPKVGKAFIPIHLAAGYGSPKWIFSLVEHCNSHIHYDAKSWVIGHRDIHLNNIVWKNAHTPHLIDWESAGLIHPFVELIGLASNCCGLASGLFEEGKFKATLRGYANFNNHLPQTDDVLWHLTFHTWLLWYAFNANQGRHDEARKTLEVIEFIKDKMTKLKHIYTQFTANFQKL